MKLYSPRAGSARIAAVSYREVQQSDTCSGNQKQQDEPHENSAISDALTVRQM